MSVATGAPALATLKLGVHLMKRAGYISDHDYLIGTKIAEVDFERHVASLFGRLGCNSAACHGSFQGKGGFRLSLRGYDPTADHPELTRDVLGRRSDYQMEYRLKTKRGDSCCWCCTAACAAARRAAASMSM